MGKDKDSNGLAASRINHLIAVMGKHTDWNHPTWPGTIVTIWVSYFMTGGPGKEHVTKKPLLTRKVWERSKGDTTCPITSQNPSCWHLSELSNACTTRKDSESEQLAKDNQEMNPITIKSKLLAMWQSSPLGFPYPTALRPAPLPNNISCFVSSCISLGTSFPSVNLLGPGRVPLPATQVYWFCLATLI